MGGGRGGVRCLSGNKKNKNKIKGEVPLERIPLDKYPLAGIIIFNTFPTPVPYIARLFLIIREQGVNSGCKDEDKGAEIARDTRH